MSLASTRSLQPYLPPLMWRTLRRRLIMAAANPAARRTVDARLLKLQRQAPFLPPDMICREIIALSWIAMSEAEEPDTGKSPPTGGEGPMT